MIEFSKLSPTETPKYVSTDFDTKINRLKRETAYLLAKVQQFVPKAKTTTTTTAKVPTKTDDTKTPESETTKTTTPSTGGKNLC